MENNTVRITANANVVQFLSTSGNLAAQLPGWKQGVLEASLQAFNSQPRTPVVNTDQSVSQGFQRKKSR